MSFCSELDRVNESGLRLQVYLGFGIGWRALMAETIDAGNQRKWEWDERRQNNILKCLIGCDSAPTNDVKRAPIERVYRVHKSSMLVD
jgi:hypothetical protein